jgi:glucose-6-phosphate 1-dehydrogenase
MNDASQLDELLSCRLDNGRRNVEPCTIVIFGASGDLTSRKLIPALYHLFVEGSLPRPFRIIGFARREKTDDSWRAELREALGKFSRSKTVDDAKWAKFAASISYCRGDLTNPKDFEQLALDIREGGTDSLRNNLLFYLSIMPSQFAEVVENLHTCGLLQRPDTGGESHRVIVEKPFGTDLRSAHALNAELMKFCHEAQIFRIDHYLGKETVQNILTFRFSNSIFEQLWTRQSVEQVQITVSENLGVGARGGYYEESGALRDMVQNHLLQVLSLVAMEPPVSLEAESIRDEKVKLLRSIRPLAPGDVLANVASTRPGKSPRSSAPLTATRRRSRRIQPWRPTWPCGCSSTTGGGPPCLSICAPAKTCRSARAKCVCSSAIRPTSSTRRSAIRSSTPTRSRCASSQTRAFRCGLTARFRARACSFARCA